MKAFRLLLLACCTVSPAAAQLVPLTPAPGEDAVETACAVCHSLSYIPMNSHFMTAETWKAEVTKMRMAFGAPIDDDSAKAIVAYLVSHYGAPPP
jgi:cytochrome c2